ncbi:LemA family protein [Candidatus Nomurabacteria bacterium]|nr:LemA family protein [Candidatus Nomurabacteria bacterium]
MTIILIIAIILVGWFVLTYNSFIKGKNQFTEAWADIEVQLKRRYDLIPNLVNTVKGYSTHESGVFEKVTQARSQAMQAGSLADHAKAEGELTGALKSLFAISEAYPDLKANTNFLELQRELSDTENKIQSARRFYNGTVRDFNTRLQVFPSNMVANMFGFKSAEFFDLADNDAAQQPVEVKF